MLEVPLQIYLAKLEWVKNIWLALEQSEDFRIFMLKVVTCLRVCCLITCDVTVWRQYILPVRTVLQSVKQILEVWNEQLRISIFGTFLGRIVHLPFENINVNFSPNVECFNSLITTAGLLCCHRQIYEVYCKKCK